MRNTLGCHKTKVISTDTFLKKFQIEKDCKDILTIGLKVVAWLKTTHNWNNFAHFPLKIYAALLLFSQSATKQFQDFDWKIWYFLSSALTFSFLSLSLYCWVWKSSVYLRNIYRNNNNELIHRPANLKQERLWFTDSMRLRLMTINIEISCDRRQL